MTFRFEPKKVLLPGNPDKVEGLLAYDERGHREFLVVPKRTGLSIYLDRRGNLEYEFVGELPIKE
jgi:hypothetical protein